MADHTRRFWLTTLNQPTDQTNLHNYKFTDGDRILLDRLLRFAVENHAHTGQVVTTTRAPAPILSTYPREGSIPGNATVHYRFSIVDERGQEAIASQVATIQTPSQASAPAFAPRLSRQSGTLEGGEYIYAVSACTNESTQETILGPLGAGTLTGFGGWYVDLPPMPSGGQFFNVYRRGPTDSELVYLFTTDPETRWFIDDGDRRPNRFRTVPTANTTNMTNRVEIALPQPWPTGSWTWKIYRTFDVAQWDNSLLDWIGSNTYYIDDGRATRPGYPPDASAAVGGAPKIRLVKDTTGTPPASVASGATRLVNFNADLVQEGPGTWHWVNEYTHAELLSMRATVNRANPPTLGDCTIGIDRLHDATWVKVIDTWSGQPFLSRIPVGGSIGDACSLETLSGYLRPGERLRLHVHQAGYELTEINHDLTLVVNLRVHDGLSNQSYVWETS
jgi:hypothetical protein